MPKSRINIVHFILVLVIAIAVALIDRVYFIEPTLVRDASMSPTLHDHDRLLISKKSEPERLDVVVFHTSDNHSLVKRVIGLPGEKVEYKDDTLYIDGYLNEDPSL